MRHCLLFATTVRLNATGFLASLGMTCYLGDTKGVGGSTAALPPYYPQPPSQASENTVIPSEARNLPKFTQTVMIICHKIAKAQIRLKELVFNHNFL